MFLVVDVGNSHTVTGLYEGDTLIGQWRLQSNRQSTADELGIEYTALFKLAGIDQQKLSSIIIASVVPTLESAWIACCERYLKARLNENLFVVQVECISELVTVSLDNPREVGADRLVNSIAAWEQFHCKLVVIDFGTAITFDCVTMSDDDTCCTYLGGAILPGIAISLDALASRTARLPHIDIAVPPRGVIGKSTVQAMKSGIMYGYGGMIDGLVSSIKTEMLITDDEPFKVIATGGMARLIAPFATTIDEIDPLLTLNGLRIIHDKLQSRCN